MTSVTKELFVKAPRETVWRHFEDPDLLAAWLMRNSFSGRVGQPFQFFARPSNDWDGVLHCRLVEFEPPRKVSYTWDANDIQGETLVTIELHEEDDGTRIRLIHANFEKATLDVATIVRRHDAGWTDHLRLLESQLAEELAGRRESPVRIDWTRFDLHVAIAAEPARVLEAWSTIDGMESFFVQVMRITDADARERGPKEPARPGDRFIWRWPTGRYVKGEYLSVDLASKVCFTFGDSKVCVVAQPYRSGTLLRLTQFEIPDDDEARMHIHANCRGGWVYFLSVLKTLMEHGVDGRDMSRDTGASFSTYFDPASVGVAY